jgi:uncharacterized protein (DUF169 family)
MTTTELIAGTARLRQMIGLRHEPLAFFYTDREPAGYQPPHGEAGCLIAALTRARHGETVLFDAETIGCPGGTYFLGFCEPRPGIAEFVSTGIPGQVEGERYKKSPELVTAMQALHPVPPAPARYAVFLPIAALPDGQEPAVVICFAGPDELCGLVSLAGFERADDAVLSPFGSGCSALVSRPLAEAQHDPPRAILGGFDPSARPYLAADELSFAAPAALWAEMLKNMEESFLITPTWAKIRRRIGH